MKVLHVFTLFTTAQSFFDGQFKFLADNGYSIHLITSQSLDTLPFTQKNSVTYKPIDIRRKISPFSDVKSIWELCKYIKKEKIEIVVGHTPKGALIAMCSSFIMNVSCRLYYRHGLIYTTATGIKRFLFKSIEIFVSMLSTKIINVSPSLSALAIDDGLNKDKKQLIIGQGTCGGIDAVDKFNPECIQEKTKKELYSQLNISTNNLVIGFCGRVCIDKGIIELVDGFEQFSSKHNDLLPKLILIGDYDIRDVLPQRIKDKIDSNPNIIVTGYVNNNIEYYYSILDMFVFPSHREGFGMSVIEASAMRKPIIVSRSHGCVDSIIEGVTGIYTDLLPEDISLKMSMLIDIDKREELGSNGRRFVLENYDYRIMWPKILEIYKNLEKNV